MLAVLLVSACAVLAGARSFVAIGARVPHESAIRRLLQQLDPAAVEDAKMLEEHHGWIDGQRGTGGTESKIAWLYLRVSTPSQVHTDYGPEGISIPAQRVAAQHKATELGATVAREFVEPGRTATTIDKRPSFQEMLAAVRAAAPAERPDYIVVLHFNRIFRNTIGAAITKNELGRHGVRDNPPAGLSTLL